MHDRVSSVNCVYINRLIILSTLIVKTLLVFFLFSHSFSSRLLTNTPHHVASSFKVVLQPGICPDSVKESLFVYTLFIGSKANFFKINYLSCLCYVLGSTQVFNTLVCVISFIFLEKTLPNSSSFNLSPTHFFLYPSIYLPCVFYFS